MSTELPGGVHLRLLSPEDSMEELTELLHRAYKALGDMGLRFLATHQDAATTRRRCAKGETWVGVREGRLACTVTLQFPITDGGTPWYDQPGVAMFGQFGVDPALQGLGIGSRLMGHVEARAAALGANELGLDTSERALHLIDFYRKRGYRFIEHVTWDSVNYRSVVMSKTLPPAPEAGS